jgi:methyl-accepting chemotaxis protein
MGTKLTISSACLLALMMVLGGFSLRFSSELASELERAVKIVARKQLLAGQISTATAEMRIAERGIAFSTVLQQSDKAAAFARQFDQADTAARSALREFSSLEGTAETKAALDQLYVVLGQIEGAHRNLLSMLSNQQIDLALKTFEESTLPKLMEMNRVSKHLVTEQGEQLETLAGVAERRKAGTVWVILVLSGISAAAAVSLILVVRGMSGKLRDLTGRLASCADEVSDASSRIAASSQQLAEGATRQAASLEETSASSQEMSSVTQRNAENSVQAARVTQEVDGRVQEANATLEAMVTSMQEINASSEKIASIIKVIDEISFQTNILALNAAVEAARAGEAGMGFAVVADEVRNLAQRCAQAAKDTAGLIEDSIRTSAEGGRKLEKMSDAIVSITESSARIKQLVEELNLSSQEQAQGIDHIAGALQNMEHVTQQVSASARESASVSDDMARQAGTMSSVVTELVALVGQSKL